MDLLSNFSVICFVALLTYVFVELIMNLIKR